MTPALSCLHAGMLCRVHSPHLTHCACFGGWSPFSGKLHFQVIMCNLRSTHTHTQVAAVSTEICCKVFRTCRGGLQSRPLCSEVFTCSDKCLPCWLSSSRLLFFTSGPWGIEKACWFSCLLPMLILFSMGNLSIVQFWFIYTRKVQINSVYSISTGHNCCSLPGPERHNGKESGNEMFPFSFETNKAVFKR